MSKERKWALSISFFGLLIILVTIILEGILPHTHIAKVALTLFEHLGVAIIVVGIVGVIVDFDDWRKYFQERVAETIIKRNYLWTLDEAELISLQTDALKAFFQVEDIDRKGSFLEYFHTRIRDFIGNPYREDTSSVISISCSEPDDLWTVEEAITYKCRKVGDYIQEDVKWFLDPGEGQLEDFWISLQIPKNFYQSPDFKTRYPNVSEHKIVFNKGDRQLEKSAEGDGFRVALTDYNDIDALGVKVYARYLIKAGRVLTWKMTYPSNRVSLTFRFPSHLELFLEPFGITRDDLEEDVRAGFHSIRYDSWLLPYSGFAYQFYVSSQYNQAGQPN